MIVGAGKRKSKSEKTQETQDEATLNEESFPQHILSTIESRDYTATSTFIKFIHEDLGRPYTKEIALWHGYALFHLGDYSGAIDIFQQRLKEEPEEIILNLYLSSCNYYLHDFETAKEYAKKGPKCELQTRLLFHISHQLGDEQEMFQAHSQLVGTFENQLSLAAIHFMRSNYQNAIDVYQKLLLEHPDYLALNVYVSMCQFKLDLNEDANQSVDQYLNVNSDSSVALNLKSCTYLRLYDPNIAESQLLQIKKVWKFFFHFC